MDSGQFKDQRQLLVKVAVSPFSRPSKVTDNGCPGPEATILTLRLMILWLISSLSDFGLFK